MKKVLFVILILILVLSGIVLVNTLTFTSRQLDVAEQPMPDYDYEEAAYRLGEAVRIPTISTEDTTLRDVAAFEAFIRFAERTYPLVHRQLEREIVNGYSLLFTWPGTDASLDPWLLMGHYDVVPVEPSSVANWDYDPFGGVIADGYIWGRGTLDDKITVMGVFEAVEWLLAEGLEPKRTLQLAFGHDEEIGGEKGAKAIASLLESRGVRLAMVLDEGGLVIEGEMPGIDAPVAMIGTSEKGYLNLELIAEDEGGHSSMPPSITASGRIARAVARLQENPMPASLSAGAPMFSYLVPEMGFGQRLALGNTWLFGPVIRKQLEASPSTNAIIRTTTAPTMLAGSQKPNVLPSRATAVVNFRLLPGDDMESVVRHVERSIDDPLVVVEPMGAFSPASPVSDTETPAFDLLHRSIKGFYPQAYIAPYLVMGATDARHFTGISDQVFRFMPVQIHNDDLVRLHGTNERVSVQGYARSIAFYRHLIMEIENL
ncbi:MAG: M20 family peptidase [Rhodothermaceae bacterium]|nr:M20 family peptidase [Rhodothermaceae bacterium]